MMRCVKVLLIFVITAALSAVVACEEINIFKEREDSDLEISETEQSTGYSEDKTYSSEESKEFVSETLSEQEGAPEEIPDEKNSSSEEESTDTEENSSEETSDEEETLSGESGSEEVFDSEDGSDKESSDGEDSSDEEETLDTEDNSESEETSDSEDSPNENPPEDNEEKPQEQENEIEYTSSEFFIFNKINGKEEYSVRIKPSEKYNLPDEIYIPAEHNGCKVVQIENPGFSQTNITKIVIPEGIKIINNEVFLDCIYLKEVVLPETLIKIKEGAFSNCIRLTSVTFKDANGWKAGGETVSEYLTDSATSATLLKTDYVDRIWKKS